MSDIIVATCCSMAPVVQMDGEGSAYIVCPKCKKRSPSFSIHRDGIIVRKQAERAADAWNKTVKEGMNHGK